MVYPTSKLPNSTEREGFEPPVHYCTTVFKTAAFDHSAISPKFVDNIITYLRTFCQAKYYIFYQKSRSMMLYDSKLCSMELNIIDTRFSKDSTIYGFTISSKITTMMLHDSKLCSMELNIIDTRLKTSQICNLLFYQKSRSIILHDSELCSIELNIIDIQFKDF